MQCQLKRPVSLNRQNKSTRKQGSPHTPQRVPDFLCTKHTSNGKGFLLLRLYPALPLFGKWQMKGNEDMTAREERIFAETYEIALGDEKFKKHTKEAIDLGHCIMNILGVNKNLFLEYERCSSLAEGIYLENVYQSGVEDGLDKYQDQCSTKCSTDY